MTSSIKAMSFEGILGWVGSASCAELHADVGVSSIGEKSVAIGQGPDPKCNHV